jgi:hypothetical protein
MSFKAISRVKFPDSMRDKVISVGVKMLPIANRQAGLISVSFNESVDSNETMMIWDWESKADHEACMASEDWAQLMQESASIFQTEAVEFFISYYESVAI